jgi:hypothetical protein
MPCFAQFTTWMDKQQTVAHPESAYHYAVEVYQEILPFVKERPGVIRAECIGWSIEGQPLWAFHIHDPARESIGSMLVFANIHALEWVPTEDALAFLKEAVQWPRAVDLTVIPILNPDGRRTVEQDLLEGRNEYHRGNSEHIDLNRDFAINRQAEAIWRFITPGYYRTSPAALSQPETRAIDALAAREMYDASVSLHAFGGFIYYPWAGRWARTPDQKTFHTLGRAMQAGMGAHAYRPRQLSRWGFFFRAQGADVDHFYGEYGTMSFLVETTRSGIARLQDKNTYFRWYNPRDPSRHIREGVRLLRALYIEVEAGRAQRVTPPKAIP